MRTHQKRRLHPSTVSAKRLLDSDGGHSLVASAWRNALLGWRNRDDSTGRARMLEATFTGKVEPVQNPLDILRGHERENMCITHMSQKQSISARSPKYDGHRGERPSSPEEKRNEQPQRSVSCRQQTERSDPVLQGIRARDGWCARRVPVRLVAPVVHRVNVGVVVIVLRVVFARENNAELRTSVSIQEQLGARVHIQGQD